MDRTQRKIRGEYRYLKAEKTEIAGFPDPPAGGGVAQLPALPDSEASTVTALRQDYNNLLAALRTAGLMASAPADGGGDG
jgi:hypothetical protein